MLKTQEDPCRHPTKWENSHWNKWWCHSHWLGPKGQRNYHSAIDRPGLPSNVPQRSRGSNCSDRSRRVGGFSDCLINSALIRAISSECVYLSNRQSMSIKVYLHTPSKRAETTALLDSGATENFINHQYTQQLWLPVKRLAIPRKVFNADGTTNQKGDITFYSDLEVRTGEKCINMQFFLTELGPQRMILGYPWFAAMQPKINWVKGWIDYTQLPIVIKTPNAHKSTFVSWLKAMMHGKQWKAVIKNAEVPRSEKNHLPKEYQRHQKVFSEQKAQRFPKKRSWDHTINLKPNAPSSLPGKVYFLMQPEQAALKEFLKKQLEKGYIRPSKSPYAAPFFFIKKKSGELRPVQDYRKVNEWTVKNRYPLPLIPELINRVKGASLFLKFDIRWGYNNIWIKEGDEWKAAFTTN